MASDPDERPFMVQIDNDTMTVIKLSLATSLQLVSDDIAALMQVAPNQYTQDEMLNMDSTLMVLMSTKMNLAAVYGSLLIQTGQDPDAVMQMLDSTFGD